MNILWKKLLGLLALWLGLAWLSGMLFNHALLWLVLAFAGFLVWLLFRLHRFEQWLNQSTGGQAYDDDVLGNLYYSVDRKLGRVRKKCRRLNAELEQYRKSAAALPDATAVLDRNGVLVWFNDAAAMMLGLRDVDIGQRVENLIRNPDFVTFLQAREYGEPLELPSPLSHDKVLQLHVVPYGGRQLLLVARDVTYFHAIDVMRKDFIANVSHELNTPLTVLSGYLEAFEQSPQPDQRLQGKIRPLLQQTERMKQIVADLMMLSRLESSDYSGDISAVNVAELARDVIDTARIAYAGKVHHFTLDADDTLWLRGVSKELRSAFQNLVNNACQYTDSGGRIEISWCLKDDDALFSVCDNGVGIAAQFIPRLTERFFRVDAGRSRDAGGTGLGLSIVRHVLMRHDAVLEISSVPGQGSCFRCRFPASRIIRRDAG